MALDELLAAQAVLHYVYPLTVFLYFIASSTVAICTLQTSSEAAKTRHRRHKTIYYLLLLFLFCYAAQSILKLAVIVSRHHWPSQDDIIGLLSCILVYGIQQSSLSPARDSTVWYPFYGSWLLGILFEPTIAVLMIISFQGDALSSPTSSASHVSRNPLLWAEVSLYAIRWALLLSVFLTYAIWRNRSESGGCDPEQTPLIPKPNLTSSDANASTDSGYGTNSDSNNTETNNNETTTAPKDAESSWDRRERLAREQIEKRLKSEGSWISYVKGFFIFIPYIWPVGNRRLQTHAALVGVCLLANNGLNFLIPRQYGMVMDSLSGVSGKNPWVQVAIFAGLRLLSSEAGISLIRQLLWLPVEYYSREAMTMAAFSHVMSLSSEFHDSKSTSDTIVAISRGDSISDMLESICFRAIPSIIDLIVAFAYLSAKFGPYEGFITVATGMAFVQASTMIISGFRTQRREVMKSYFEEHYIRQAGIQGWETVTAFNQTAYEENRHRNATKSYVTGVKAMLSRMFIAYAFQYVILLAGLLAGAFLAVYQITHGQATPGDFVMLLSYWSQLTSPLHYFSMLGRKLSQDLIDAERLLELMLTKPTVVNKPNAKTICLKGGKVEFRNVSFSYDKKKDILKGVKLTAPAGTTVAFVGSTGAGKSTILKLLDRFYDVTGGSILIDGQDVRDVTLASLRQCIGIVPQSPILFDDTIMNNIRYARLSATDEEVYSACKAAAVHDQIMGFTEGYMTRVGERGVKLSGGELQRVAIARAILKGPEVVLLDEATSSVDVETEHKIQDGLRNLCRDRTTFIVAHRLSTVVNADVIFVIADGEVVEQGSHENLLAQNGRYADLWSKQAFVRPKDSKAGDVSTETGNPAARNGQTDGPMDNPKAEAQSSSCNPQPGGSTPKPTNAKTAGKANGQVAETPNGHQKEGSKLNPSAPEFTPRSIATPRPPPRPRNTWAEDVEEEVVSRVNSPKKGPAMKMETASISTAMEAYEALPRTESGRPVSPEQDRDQSQDRGMSPEPANPRASDSVPRRNTLHSFSCPDAPLRSFEGSPTRSSSQPMTMPLPSEPDSSPTPTPTPPPIAVPAAIRPDPENVPKPTIDQYKEPKIVESATRPPQGPSRGRGFFRGRSSRGKYRGGRSRRNTSNQAANRGGNSATVGAS